MHDVSLLFERNYEDRNIQTCQNIQNSSVVKKMKMTPNSLHLKIFQPVEIDGEKVIR